METIVIKLLIEILQEQVDEKYLDTLWDYTTYRYRYEIEYL